MKKLLYGGTVVNVFTGELERVDVLIDDEKIIDIIWIKRDFDGERYIVTVLFPEEY